MADEDGSVLADLMPSFTAPNIVRYVYAVFFTFNAPPARMLLYGSIKLLLVFVNKGLSRFLGYFF
ncbi:MAG: hypothetical protein ACREBU_03815 [Nitrososphaera sp.]